MKARRGSIAKSTLKLGSASATITATYSLAGKSPAIDATMSGPNMPLPELLAFLPTFDIVLPTGAKLEGGTVSAEVTARGPVSQLNSTGAIKIEKTKLTGYDLGGKLRILQQFAGLPTAPVTDIALAGAKFDTDSGGTRVREIVFTAPAIGQLTGDGTVSRGACAGLQDEGCGEDRRPFGDGVATTRRDHHGSLFHSGDVGESSVQGGCESAGE